MMSIVCGVFVLGSFVSAQAQTTESVLPQSLSPTVRVKDIGKIIESRDNQIIGFGLVVGLRNTGDSRSTAFTKKALTNLLKKMGLPPDSKEFNSRNVASVMVTGSLPPYTKKGQRISVLVSSLGDARSLVGGTLLLTPLMGADFNTYAVAQGPVIVGGVIGTSNKGQVRKNSTTVGRVPNGAIVEKEVPITALDQNNITIVLEQPNFITASRVATALVKADFEGTKAIDASTIKVPVLKKAESMSFVEIIAELENVSVVPDTSSKVVVNSRTGTVVIGQMVRLFPVAITHGGISIKIAGNEGAPSVIAFTDNGPAEGVEVAEEPSKLVYLSPQATLSSLVDALNEIGVPPKEMISILQALKQSGALIASLEVI